jgi:hypothetical protein
MITLLLPALLTPAAAGKARAVSSEEKEPDERHERPAGPSRQGCMQDTCLSFLGANLGFDVIFNTKDVFLGASYEHPLMQKEKLDLNAEIFFYGRPFDKTSFEQTGPTTYHQYREKRYITGAKVTQKMWLGEVLGVFGGAGYGYTFGSFNGTDRPARDRWTPHFFGGVSVSFAKMIFAEGGYQFTKIPHSPDHFIFTSISCNFFTLLGSAGEDDRKKPGRGEKPKPDEQGDGQ